MLNYKFVLHNNLKVKDIIRIKAVEYSSSIIVIYEDNSSEEFNYAAQTYNISTKHVK